MNITVINGTEKHGVTYRLKEMFLADFSDNANITEYYLPSEYYRILSSKGLPRFLRWLHKLYLKGRTEMQGC